MARIRILVHSEGILMRAAVYRSKGKSQPIRSTEPDDLRLDSRPGHRDMPVGRNERRSIDPIARTLRETERDFTCLGRPRESSHLT